MMLYLRQCSAGLSLGRLDRLHLAVLAVLAVCDLVALGRLGVVILGCLLLLAAAVSAGAIGRGLARFARWE